MPTSAASRLGDRARSAGGSRGREGWSRVRLATGPILLAAATAGAAYGIARGVLGQPYPFFAPAAAWLSLGFGRDRGVRRVAEMAIGVSLGVALGEVMGRTLGVGWWQVGVALAVAAILARLLDAAPLMTTQAGIQAVIVVALPSAVTGGSMGRWIDALLGGGLALLVAVAFPGRSWRRAHLLAREGMSEVGGTLAMLAAALRAGNLARAADTLEHGRATQPVLDEWRSVAARGTDAVRFSPLARRHRAEIEQLARAARLADQAMRNVRVVSRRSLTAIETHGPLVRLGDLVGRLALAAGEIGESLGTGGDPAAARPALSELAVQLQPDRDDEWRVQSLVVLLRSLLVDLLQLTGVSYEQAKAQLAG